MTYCTSIVVAASLCLKENALKMSLCDDFTLTLSKHRRLAECNNGKTEVEVSQTTRIGRVLPQLIAAAAVAAVDAYLHVGLVMAECVDT